MTIALDAFPFHLLDPGIDRRSTALVPDASIEARGANQVDSKSESFRANRVPSASEFVRPMLDEMVAAQESAVGGRMEAYQVVGRWVGVEGTWVRRLLGRQKVGVSGDRLLAITAAYRRHCERVERRAAETRAATARRWEEIDAVLHGLGEPDRRGPGLHPESAGEGERAVRGAETCPGGRP